MGHGGIQRGACGCHKERDRLKVLHEVKKRDETMKYLEAGLRMCDPDMVNIQNDPVFAFLHSDPRYHTLIKKIGL